MESLQTSFLSENQLNGLNHYLLILCRHPSVIESFYYLTWDFMKNRSDNDDMVTFLR